MAKYKDVEMIEGLGGCLYQAIPVASLVLTHSILKDFIYRPLALGLGVLVFGLVSYWIPEKSKRRFLVWAGMTVLIGAACFGLAHLAVKLGWIAEGAPNNSFNRTRR